MTSEGKKIFLFPSFYDIQWTKDLNAVLSEVFHCPLPKIPYDTYLPSKSLTHQFYAKALPMLRNGKYDGVFFTNLLEDFSLDLLKTGFVQNIYGIVHGSNFLDTEPGQLDKLKDYELSTMLLVGNVYVPSQYFQSVVPYPTTPIGLPITRQRIDPAIGDRKGIVFNHRLAKEKHPERLFQLPPHLLEQTVVATPKFSTVLLKQMRDKNIPTHTNLTLEEYEELLKTSKVAVSFTEHETFGYAVLEAAQMGCAVVVPDKLSYQENIIEDFRYKTFAEAVEKIERFLNNEQVRCELVRKQQKVLDKFTPDQWRERLLKTMKI
jgi:glycosyltransferase involved in cell wall biosynthesis